MEQKRGGVRNFRKHENKYQVPTENVWLYTSDYVETKGNDGQCINKTGGYLQKVICILIYWQIILLINIRIIFRKIRVTQMKKIATQNIKSTCRVCKEE